MTTVIPASAKSIKGSSLNSTLTIFIKNVCLFYSDVQMKLVSLSFSEFHDSKLYKSFNENYTTHVLECVRLKENEVGFSEVMGSTKIGSHFVACLSFFQMIYC